MKFSKLVLILFVLSTTSVFSQSWVVQPNPATGDIIQIHAVNQDTVYASTTKEILKTTNGGTNWEVVLSKPWRNLKGLQVVDPITGLHRIYTWYHSGLYYYRSFDGGVNWDSVQVPSTTGYMQFLDLNTTYFNNSGQGGTGFFFTTNSGLNWYNHNASYGNMNVMGSMHFINELTGFINGGTSWTYYHVLIKTTDRGFSWSPLMNSGSNGYESGGDFRFFPNGVGYHVSNRTYKTTNNGDNWTQLNTQGAIGPHCLFMHNDVRGWLGKQNGLLKTTNGCSNWDNQNIGVPGINIYSVSFINYNTGWISGSSAHILKTTNGSGVLAPTQPPVNLNPPNNSGGHSLTPMLVWNPVSGATNYRVQVSVDLFATLVLDYDTVSITQFQIPAGYLNHNVQYYWRIAGTNIGGQGPWSVTWNFTTGLVGIHSSGNEIPAVFKLYNNYPNPFNPVTSIKFDLPEQSYTKLVVYDLLGKEVKTLVNMQLQSGSYTADLNADGLSSGIYFYRIETGKFTDIKKMILVK